MFAWLFGKRNIWPTMTITFKNRGNGCNVKFDMPDCQTAEEQRTHIETFINGLNLLDTNTFVRRLIDGINGSFEPEIADHIISSLEDDVPVSIQVVDKEEIFNDDEDAYSESGY